MGNLEQFEKTFLHLSVMGAFFYAAYQANGADMTGFWNVITATILLLVIVSYARFAQKGR